MPEPASLSRKFAVLAGVLDERTRRLVAAAEADPIGYGGVSAVARASGLSRGTFLRGIADVETYAPGYRLKQKVQFDRFPATGSSTASSASNGSGDRAAGIKSSIFLEIEGAAHYLPAYAGNLDIMTSAALKTAEKLAERNE
jgi:hypothetical protein